LYSNIMPS